MRFTYCPDCGALLQPRSIGDEGLIPYCKQCQKPWFDMFSTCVIVLVVNECNEAALLQQAYISTEYRNLISGYMKPGETAEETAIREVDEEIGIEMTSLELVRTYWFGLKDMLMVGFIGRAPKTAFRLSGEVDGAEWVPVQQAIQMVHPKGSVSYALLEEYINRHNKEEI